VPYEDGVEALFPDRGRRRVTDQEHRVTSGEFASRLADHGRGEVDAGDAVSLLGREERQAAGAAAEVEQVARALRKPVAQPPRPGRAHLRVAQPVVRFLVEGGGRRVPVDTRRSRPVTLVCHAPKSDTRH
jgi:hypothetical protein